MDYSFRLTTRVLLYAPSHRQDNTYHGFCYTSGGELAGTRHSSMGPLHEGSILRPIAHDTIISHLKNQKVLCDHMLYLLEKQTNKLPDANKASKLSQYFTQTNKSIGLTLRCDFHKNPDSNITTETRRICSSY